jgi:hypothetical protein
MHIVAGKVLEVGSILRLEIVLPGRPGVLAAFAEVVWANENGGGLRFMALTEEAKEALRFFLQNSSLPL